MPSAPLINSWFILNSMALKGAVYFRSCLLYLPLFDNCFILCIIRFYFQVVPYSFFSDSCAIFFPLIHAIHVREITVFGYRHVTLSTSVTVCIYIRHCKLLETIMWLLISFLIHCICVAFRIINTHMQIRDCIASYACSQIKLVYKFVILK